jgi:hypothetical protein
MRAAILLVPLLLVAACGPQSSGGPATASAARTPSPTATSTPALAGAYAVLVKDFLVSGGASYTLSIVSSDGRVAATATARKRTVKAVQIGNVSTSNTAAYYLDGDSDVHFLRPDGTTGLATRITVAAGHVAAFSVSPDDSRIAVAVLDYTRYPVGTRLYVEDLKGGGNHVELFSGSNVMEWPAGWHAGHLVLALGINLPPQNLFEGFARGHGYHVADAQTGTRLFNLCAGMDSSVPETPAGTVCVNYPKASVVSWDGQTRVLPNATKPDSTSGVCGLAGPLSPAGVVATNVVSVPQGGCAGGPAVFLVNAQNTIDPRVLVRDAEPIGWLDAGHLVVDIAPSASLGALSIVDVSTLAASRIQAPGFFAAAIPGGL